MKLFRKRKVPKSLSIERHGWRGFRTGGDLFDAECCLGFLTFYVSNESIAESIRDMKAKIAEAKKFIGGK